jgi:hypothetical protein
MYYLLIIDHDVRAYIPCAVFKAAHAPLGESQKLANVTAECTHKRPLNMFALGVCSSSAQYDWSFLRSCPPNLTGFWPGCLPLATPSRRVGTTFARPRRRRGPRRMSQTSRRLAFLPSRTTALSRLVCGSACKGWRAASSRARAQAWFHRVGERGSASRKVVARLYLQSARVGAHCRSHSQDGS